MERKQRIMLLAIILLIACAAMVVAAYALNLEIGYVAASALALTGSVFWINAE